MSLRKLNEALVRLCDVDTTLQGLLGRSSADCLDPLDTLNPEPSPLRFLGYEVDSRQTAGSGDQRELVIRFVAVADEEGGGVDTCEQVLDRVEQLVSWTALFNGGADPSVDAAEDLVSSRGKSPIDTQGARGVVARELVFQGGITLS